jgi:hypothetical protein
MASQGRNGDERAGPLAGARGGVDPYAPAREATGDPTEITTEPAPAPQRSLVVPLAIALAVFVIVIVARLLWHALAGAR